MQQNGCQSFQEAPFYSFRLCEILKRNIFVLKLGFLRPSTLNPIFVFLKDWCFFYATFLKFVFIEAPLQFLQETKRFASVKDSSRFSALCDLPESSKKISNFFPQFSVFLKSFPSRKMEFLLFPVGEEWFSRPMSIPSGIFWRCKIDEILTMSL